MSGRRQPKVTGPAGRGGRGHPCSDLGVLALLLVALFASGCYLTRTLAGGARVLAARRPVEKVLSDPAAEPRLREHLRTVLEIRDFARRELGLPGDRSYGTYVELDRPFAVWTVVATPELSVEPLRWCFPVVGCVSYRGYFSERRAERFAGKLRRRGRDVEVGGRSAFSTLGWFRDPVLSTFVHLPGPELAGLIFHELAHQRLFVRGDVELDESFATVVELEGVGRWLAVRGDEAAATAYRRRQQRAEDLARLLRTCRERLAAVYAEERSEVWKRRRKEELFAELKTDYRELRDGLWGGWDGYDAWFEQDLGNAHLASAVAYERWRPALEALLESLGGDLERFYAEVEELGRLPREERAAALERMVSKTRGGSSGTPSRSTGGRPPAQDLAPGARTADLR